jgi:hypothetical protein
MRRVDRTRIRVVYPLFRQKPVYEYLLPDPELQTIVNNAAVAGENNMVWNDTPAEVPDGIIREFTLKYTVKAGTDIAVYLNGLMMDDGADFILIDNKTVRFAIAPFPESVINASYTKA